MRILVTGGAGFIGSALVRHLIAESEHEVLNYDKLTYAGHLSSLKGVDDNPRYRFNHGDVCDAVAVRGAIATFRPQVIAHLAAESHVDRSIDDPADFIQTNLVGTFVMLQAARRHWSTLNETAKAEFRFHLISTDEVFGSLSSGEEADENSRYQ